MNSVLPRNKPDKAHVPPVPWQPLMTEPSGMPEPHLFAVSLGTGATVGYVDVDAELGVDLLKATVLRQIVSVVGSMSAVTAVISHLAPDAQAELWAPVQRVVNVGDVVPFGGLYW